MKKSKLLAEEEAREASAPKMFETDVDEHKFIQEYAGAYRIEPIQCNGDYVAIAPFPRQGVTEGGIVVPHQADVPPDTGLVVGLGTDTGVLEIGQHVKFIAKHKAADLTGEFSFYEKAEIAVYKLASIVAVLPSIQVLMAKPNVSPPQRNP